MKLLWASMNKPHALLFSTGKQCFREQPRVPVLLDSYNHYTCRTSTKKQLTPAPWFPSFRIHSAETRDSANAYLPRAP